MAIISKRFSTLVTRPTYLKVFNRGTIHIQYHPLHRNDRNFCSTSITDQPQAPQSITEFLDLLVSTGSGFTDIEWLYIYWFPLAVDLLIPLAVDLLASISCRSNSSDWMQIYWFRLP